MNVAVFIARRIAFNSQQSFSRFIIRLAVTATAVSVAAMIITLAFVNGFQETVSQKVFSFWGHVRLQQYEPNKALVAEESPLKKNDTIVNGLKQLPQIETIQEFATKSAVYSNKLISKGYYSKVFQKLTTFLTLRISWYGVTGPTLATACTVGKLLYRNQWQINYR